MNTLTLTKELISIPSYVSSKVNEQKKGEFIFRLLRQKTKLTVSKQIVSNGRFNVIARGKEPPKLLLAGHIDTVEPKKGNQTPKSLDNKLYGLGAVDMLGGVAAILSFLIEKQPDDVIALFYVDEEYNFAGMKKFVANAKGLESVELCLIPEPTNLKICNAHRGLIEVEYTIAGQAAHASRPSEGINAITQAVASVNALSEELAKYKNAALGQTTCCLSKIEGGLNTGSTKAKLVLSEGTNSIPDICRVRLDIRPSQPYVRANLITELLSKSVRKTGCVLTGSKVIWDLGCLNVDKSKILTAISAMKSVLGQTEFVSPNDMGYGDGQMIFEKFSIPTIYFGAGPTQMCHKADEYVNIRDLKVLDNYLRELYTKIN